MRIGLDVGGTHTDAVVVGKGGIVATAKVLTDHSNLLNSVMAALTEVLSQVGAKSIRGITLSTTLTTNALLEGKNEQVGVIVSSGPGIDPTYFGIGKAYYVIEGSIDHRGIERKVLDKRQLDAAIESCRQQDLRSYALITKFSTRNPGQELLMEAGLAGQADFITAGHRLSGGLNFPRRITTSYFNSSVWRQYNLFARAVEDGMAAMGLDAPVSVLKADGGTMSLTASRNLPVQSILSGPAASIMGIAALCLIDRDAVVLDIGGTSTDIAIFAAGNPLLEQEGIPLCGRPTLVRALKTSSIALGGDSAIRFMNGSFTVGPDRIGPCMSAGGKSPALMDALNVAGVAAFGDTDASRQGIAGLSERAGVTPETAAGEVIGKALEKIKKGVSLMVTEINERPVYTVHDLLYSEHVDPACLYIVGGPAAAFAPLLSRALGLDTKVPRLHYVANAVGAALTRTTTDLELFADTERRMLLVPHLSVQKSVGRDYTLEVARRDAENYLRTSLATSGEPTAEAEVQILEASSFNMVQGSTTVGRNIRVRCQIKPGYIPEYLKAVRSEC